MIECQYLRNCRGRRRDGYGKQTLRYMYFLEATQSLTTEINHLTMLRDCGAEELSSELT